LHGTLSSGPLNGAAETDAFADGSEDGRRGRLEGQPGILDGSKDGSKDAWEDMLGNSDGIDDGTSVLAWPVLGSPEGRWETEGFPDCVDVGTMDMEEAA